LSSHSNLDAQLTAQTQEIEKGTDPDFWRCRTCGCVWRDNHDGSVSLGSAKQTSCVECEMKGMPETCEPLYRSPHAAQTQEIAQLKAEVSRLTLQKIELGLRVGQILWPDYDGVSFDDVARELVKLKAEAALLSRVPPLEVQENKEDTRVAPTALASTESLTAEDHSGVVTDAKRTEER
jgi:hypothetical protein